MMMVDRLLDVTDDGGRTRLVVGIDNYFMGRDDRMNELGLMEHIAQSASAVAGYRAALAGSESAPIGMIAEVKHFACQHLPEAGDTLLTDIRFGIEVAGITIVNGVTRIDDEVVATATMKIYIA